MKIVKLTAENVKRLKAVEIQADGELVVIGGRNAQGKTSILDAIEMALRGRDSVPDRPIRQGAKSARVVLELDGPDGLTIVRRFTAKGSYLEVSSKDGKVSSPQAVLDRLCSRVGFDPLAWIREPAAKQADTLRRLVGIDWSQQDAERKRLYDQRTDANRQAKRERAAAESIPHDPNVSGPVSVAELMAELRQKQEINRRAEEIDRRCAAIQHQMREIEAKKRELESQIDRLTAQRLNLSQEWTELSEQLPDMVDTTGVEDAIADSQKINAAVAQNERRKVALQAAADREREAAAYTVQMEAIDAAKAAKLAAAKWPIDGLGFDGDAVTFNGLPLSQASAAEQLRVAVSIGLAQNPQLPVVLIRDGSLLDEDSLGAIGAQAAQCGAQVWIERVGKGEECSVVIEDGEVEHERVEG